MSVQRHGIPNPKNKFAIMKKLAVKIAKLYIYEHITHFCIGSFTHPVLQSSSDNVEEKTCFQNKSKFVILYNTWTLQLNKVNQMKLYT